MARYGEDFAPRRSYRESGGYGGGRDQRDYGTRGGYRERGGRLGRPQGSRGRGYGAEFGGMRSDAARADWRDFPGEQGWLGAGYAGYPGGDPRVAERLDESSLPRPERGLDYGRDFGPGPFGRRGHADFTRGDDEAWRGELGGERTGAERIRAAEIMTEHPHAVTTETTAADVAKLMRELDVGIIPVVDDLGNRRLVGVITDRDLTIRVLAAGKDGKATIGAYMTEQVESVNKNDTIRDVLAVMKREQVRRVPVTDREGRLVGIIAQADLAIEYAGVDLLRQREVEEAIERISEPARR